MQMTWRGTWGQGWDSLLRCAEGGDKVYVCGSGVMVQGGGKGLEYDVHVDGIRLEQVSKFKYLGCVLDESGRNEAECSRKEADVISSLFNARDLQLECARVLHETLLISVLTYSSETML